MTVAQEITAYYDKIANTYKNDRFNNSYGQFIHRQESILLNKILHKKNLVKRKF